MRYFKYIARDANGALARGAVKSDTRSGAVARLRQDGLVPVSVGEAGAAWRPPPSGRLLARRRLGAAALAAAALLLAACLLFWRPRGGSSGGARPPGAVPEARQPSQPPGARAAGGTPAQRGAEASGAPAPFRAAAAAPRPAARPLSGPADGIPLRAGPDGEAQGGRGDEASAPAKKRQPLFRRETEQMLALYARPGVVVPPTPLSRDIEEDALAALSEDIAVTDDDTPEDEREKELVARMKEDMREFIAGGGTARAFFGLMEKRQEEEAGLLQEARRLLSDLARRGDAGEALRAHRDLNEALKAKGIAPLPLPGALRGRADAP
jgi:hypothetical protein